MKPRLYLHIGHSKVASTTIQALLDANIAAIRAKAGLVADLEFRFPANGPIKANPVGALQDMCDGGNEGKALLHQRLTELHRVLTAPRRRFDHAIVSAENLCNPPFHELFEPAKELFDVHLVYYIRRQDEWLLSAWKQWGVKQGQSVDAFCLEGTTTRYPAFTVAIQRWEPLATNIHVRPLHASALVDGSVTHDFAKAIGLDGKTLEHPGISNPSFDAAVLEVLRHNSYLFQHRDDDRVFDFLGEFLSKEHKPMRAVLEGKTRKTLCNYFEAENRALQQRFFPETDFDVIYGVDSAAAEPPPPTDKDMLLRFLGLQLRGIMDLQARIGQLEQRQK
jgi:hypothetical protein